MDLTIKSEFHDLIPPISQEEYRLLEENLLQEGCREALVIWNDYILDGHNRYEICQKHDIGFKTIEKSFENEDEAKIWIIRNQFARRNLIPAERARLVLVLKPLIMEKAKRKQKESGGPAPKKSAEPPFETRQELAKLARVSHDTIHKVEVIEEEAPQEIKEATRGGKISINRAYKATRPKNKPKQKAKPPWDKLVTSEFKESFETFLEIVRKSKKKKWSDNPKSALRDCITILEGFLST